MPDAAPVSAAPPGATIVARNYLPAARVLADSYLEHHPGAGFAVLVVDAEPSELDELAERAPGVHILAPSDLALDAGEFGRMAMAYTVTELCTAVKPWLLRRLLADHPVALYLDPDIEVFAPFGADVAELAAAHDIVLTPHVTRPMPRDGLRPSEADIMASGVFNLGFIGVSRAAEPFLAFWANRLRTDAISAVTEQLFTDQRWVDNVPALFRHTVITDPGFNVAFWNVYQRPMERRPDGRLTAGGAPLRFYHYSGYRPEKPWLASTHYADRPRVLLSQRPLLAELFDGYRRKLVAAGYARALDDVPYRWDALAGGCRVSPSLRRAFRRAWLDAERAGGTPPPSPFGVGGPGRVEAFLRWATEPDGPEQRRAGLHPWAMSVWHARQDLRLAFPDPLGEHAEALRAWCATSGVAEGELDARAVPAGSGSAPVPVRDVLGANVLGYLTAELGVGELGRLVHEAVLAAGVPVATAVEERSVSSRTGHPLPGGVRLDAPEYPVTVLCVNADMTGVTLRAHPDLGRRRYVIGVWSWELAEFPASMRAAFELVDEVWTISDFCARAIAAHAPVPVHVFPVPVRDPMAPAEPASQIPPAEPASQIPPAEPARQIPPAEPAHQKPPAGERPVMFLFAFDYNSVFARKNPVAVVEAFQQAFAGRPAEARLIIKSINGERHPADRERLRAAAAGDERITLIEDYLDAAGVRTLFAGADCYLSLHRSEGFGLTIAEAMAHGLPAIATGYGGTAEFLTADTGWPIPYRLVPVGEGNPPYPADAVWAEPDLDAAARAMREVVDDPELAARRGEAARKHVLTTRAAVTAAGWVRERLEQAYASWRTDAGTGAGGSRGPAPAAVSAVRSAREALRWRADAAAPSRLPLAPALRRAVLRGLDHYDQHQRGVLGALMDGVEQGLHRLSEQQAQLAARVDLADQRLAEARAELAALAERSTDRAEQLHAALTALETGGAARLAEALAAERAAGEQRLARVERAAAAALQQRVAELDRKLVGLLAERDARLDGAEAAAADLRRELPALRTGLLRHHDLLSPPPEGALDWPPPDGPTDRPNQPTGEPNQPTGEPNQPTGEPNRRADGPSQPAGEPNERAGGPDKRAGEATEVVPTDVGPLRLPAWDRVVLPWLRTYGRWEEHESRLLDALLPPGGGFVDIGAHVGYFTIRALRAVGAGGAVCAVEPWAPARELLEANVAANVPAAVVRAALAVLPAAAWDAGGPLRLALSAAGNSGDNRVDDSGAVEVTGLRLDEVPELAHARRIDVIKSDAQGRDHRALAGAARLLAAHRPHVLCEFDPAAIVDAGDDPVGVLRRYRSWGYHPLAVTARIVEAVEASGWRQVPLAVAESDDDLVAAAGSAPGGFLTLWLRPDDRAPTGTQGADGG